MSISSFHIGYWMQNLFVPFLIAATLILILGKGRFSGPKAYSIRLSAAFLIASVMGLVVGSPWLGTIMVSAATGLLFRYW